MEYMYQLELKVRDYECDLQAIVNNANYGFTSNNTRAASSWWWLRSPGTFDLDAACVYDYGNVDSDGDNVYAMSTVLFVPLLI